MTTSPCAQPAGVNESSGSIPTWFARVVSQFPERIAVNTPDAQWSYAELNERSDAVAGFSIALAKARNRSCCSWNTERR